MNFSWLIIVCVALVSQETFAKTQALKQHQRPFTLTIDPENNNSNSPADVQLKYASTQSLNEIDNNQLSQASAGPAIGNFRHENENSQQNSNVYNQAQGANGAAHATPDPVQQYVGLTPAASEAVQLFANYPGFNPYMFLGQTDPNEFTVQNGYNGYIVPDIRGSSQALATVDGEEEEEEDTGLIPGNLTNLFPSMRFLLSALGRTASVLFGLMGVTVMGGGLSTALCTFTPFCLTNFLPFARVATPPVPQVVTDNLNVAKATETDLDQAASAVDSALKAVEAQNDAQALEVETNRAAK